MTSYGHAGKIRTSTPDRQCGRLRKRRRAAEFIRSPSSGEVSASECEFRYEGFDRVAVDCDPVFVCEPTQGDEQFLFGEGRAGAKGGYRVRSVECDLRIEPSGVGFDLPVLVFHRTGAGLLPALDFVFQFAAAVHQRVVHHPFVEREQSEPGVLAGILRERAALGRALFSRPTY